MINRIIEWFKEDIEIVEPLDKNLATAVLLVEVSMIDSKWDSEEERKVRELMRSNLGLDKEKQDEVLVAARELVVDSNDLYRFTNRINETHSTEEKYQLVVSLWKVAFADGHIDRYEDNIIRKISELLYLHHSHFIKAKHDAQSKLNK